MKTNLDFALWWAGQGIYVNAVKPNSKALIRKAPVLEHASREPDQIKRLFAKHPDRNVGVVPGPQSNLLVLDKDVKNGARGPEVLAAMEHECGPLPETLEERSPSGGGHLFFRLDGLDLPHKDLVVNDIRGVEAFSRPFNIVVTPSHTHDGDYALIRQCEIVSLPAAHREFLLEHVVAGRDDGGPIPAGGRNEAMISEAGRLRHYNIPDAEAWETFQALNIERCTPPLDERELRKIFDSAWKYPPGYFATDQGNADRLIDAHGTELRFVFQSKRWLHWNGTRFIEDNTHHAQRLMRVLTRRMHLDAVHMPEGDIRKAALRWATISEAREKIAAALALVPSYAGITIQQTELDADPWLLGTPGAILDLRTGRPTPALQSQLIARSTRAAYDPDARYPLWVQCLERWLPDADARAFIKRFIGYCLTGLTSEQCLLLVFGESATGKTSFLQTLEHVWGDYAKRTPASTWLTKGRDGIPNDVAALAGTRLVVSTESERGAHWAQSLLKAASGEESLSARFMRGEWFSFLPQFKICFGTNFLPSYDGTDRAMTRRLRPVRFDAVIPRTERDKHLQNKLRREAAGVLNWAIEGCLEWQRDGLGEPSSVISEARDYAAANDHVATFITERCELGKLLEQTAGDLHRAFNTWCKEYTERGLTGRQFAEALTKRGYKSRHTKRGSVWEGIRLRGAMTSASDRETDSMTPY